jgi:hypothetical protein
LLRDAGEKVVKLMTPTPKVPMVGASWRGLASVMSSGEGLMIGGRAVLDEFKGK